MLSDAKLRTAMLLAITATAAAAESLTLEEALALAERHNPQLRAAAADTEAARAGIVTARAYPNPEFNLLNGNQHSRWNRGIPGPPGVLQHYSFGQPIEFRSVREPRIAAAEFARQSSVHGADEALLSVRSAVKQAFFEVLRREGEIGLARENLGVIEDLRDRIKVQVDVGEAARLELTRAEAESATARIQLRSAELRRITAISALRAAIGSPVAPDLRVEGRLDTPPPLPPLADIRARVLERHPAVARTEAEVRRSEARLQAERALRKPQPWVRAEFENQPDLGFFRIGISLPLPLWNRREGPIAEAAAGLNRANAAADMRKLELTAALERSYGLYEVASQQVAAFEQGVLKEAEAAVEAAQAAFKFGERGIIELLDAQRVLRAARLEFLNAQFDRQAALIELERLRAIEVGRQP